jgi:two-component system, chemotaxis family, CheB/CheR fusion protein
MSKSKQAVPEAEQTHESPEAAEAFEALLMYLKQSRGFDFTAYKRSTLSRRVLVRMQVVGMGSFSDYLDYLQVDSSEFTRLFNTILINVTSFFRDPAAWEFVSSDVIPSLVGHAGAKDPIRVWSAGCASGEEGYTIAMLLAEALGREQFRERVKIYGTDVDEEALREARQAIYDSRRVEGVPPELLQKYFDRQDDRFVFNKDLRRSVIFGRHDLNQDAPISRVNLLTCRNCLMYFNSEAQARILGRFQFALLNGGVLFLGKSETLLTHSGGFSALDMKRRLFTRAEHPARERGGELERPRGTEPGDTIQRLRAASADLAPMAELLIDRTGKIVQINGQLRSVFGLTAHDLGRPVQDLELSYRPFELRSSIERAYAERRPVGHSEGAWTSPSGQTLYFDLLVVPVPDTDGTFLGCNCIFTDVTRAHRLQEEVHRTHQELETALEELQSTNEELETTNEELQSTVEELETTNEELQSTNEELETMNEELQATNAELQVINQEALERGSQVLQLNTFLESIFTSLRGGVAMLDRDFYIHKWNRKAEDMWGLRADEVQSRNFLSLDIGLPVDQLKAPIRACLSSDTEFSEVVLDAINRRGKPIRVKVTCTRLAGPNGGDPQGVILLMEEADGKM